MTTLSIIIPVYNCKSFLEDCVRSVAGLNADGKDNYEIELVLVDDGSTDGSAEICDGLAEALGTKRLSIRVIHQANRGVSAARNAGLKAAEGEYILFVDSDDRLETGKLSPVMSALIGDSSIDMAVFGMSFDYYKGERIYRSDVFLPPAEGKKSLEECTGMLYALYDNNSLSALWNKIIKKSVIEESGLKLHEDMFLYEDLEFSLRVLAKCRNIYFCPEAVYRYRQAQDEGNAGRRLMRVPHIPEITDKIEAALNELDGEHKRILLSLYLTLAREKIFVSQKDGVDAICRDFAAWIDNHDMPGMIEGREYAMLLYNGQSSKLIGKRRYTKLRHGVANWIKQNIGDFRKW